MFSQHSSIFSGAGHGGRGGHGSGQALTGEPYGCLTHPVNHGCRGGSASTVAGGRGGGTIYLRVTGTLHNDGQISCNGEAGRSASGGGSGGSILMEDVGLIKVCVLVCVYFISFNFEMGRSGSR